MQNFLLFMLRKCIINQVDISLEMNGASVTLGGLGSVVQLLGEIPRRFLRQNLESALPGWSARHECAVPIALFIHIHVEMQYMYFLLMQILKIMEIHKALVL